MCKTALLEAHRMKIIILVIGLLVVLVLASTTTRATEWDNTKTYDAVTKTVTIENTFLKLFTTGEVAKLTLKTPLVYNVIRGKDRLVAEIEIKNYADTYTDAFKGLELYDVKTGKPIERQFVYKYKTIEYFNVSNQKTECGVVATSKDNPYGCRTTELTPLQHERIKWNTFDTKTLPKGNLTVGIFTDVYAGDYVEWIPTYFGVRISEWATWNESLTNNLTHYWNMNDGNGTVMKDILNRANATMISGNPYNISGKNASGLFWNGIEGNSANFSNAYTKYANRTYPYTINFWVNLTSIGDYSQIFAQGDNCGDSSWAIVSRATGGDWIGMTKPCLAEVGCKVTGFPIKKWNMVTMQINSSGWQLIYINGVLNCTSDVSSVLFVGNGSMSSWGENDKDAEGTLTGTLDEGAFWSNRTLTATDITNLYNSGNYIAYEDTATPVVVNTSVTMGLLNPLDAYISNNTFLNFRVNLTTLALNLTNNVSFYYGSGSSGGDFTLLSVVNSSSCTQEFANITPSCITSSNLGNYSYWNNSGASGASWENVDNAYDGDWSTFAISSNGGQGSNLNITYAKPSTTYKDVVWRVKDDNNTRDIIFYTPQQLSCLNAFPDYVKFTFASGLNGVYYCWNTTGATTLYTALTGNQIYEEQLMWVLDNNNFVYNTTITNGVYHWNARGCGSNGTFTNCSYASSNFTFTIDQVYPNITINNPSGAEGYFKNGMNLTLNATTIDTNLQSCWFEYNSVINYTIGCNLQYNLSLVTGVKKLFYYANDSAGNTVNKTTNWLYDIYENSRTYNTTISELSSQNFYINITHEPTLYSTVSALIYYNNQAYSAIKTTSGADSIFTSTFTIPNITSASELKTFYWTFTLSNSTGTYYINSTTSTQNVTRLLVDNCSTYTNRILNYTFYDETTKSMLIGADNTTFEIILKIGDSSLTTYRELSFNKTGLNPVGICTNIPYVGNNRLDAVVKYSATEKVTEYHNIQNLLLAGKSFPIWVGLYPLANVSSTTFYVTYKNKNYLPVSDAVIQVDRLYVPDNNFTTVEMPKTDTFGKSIVHLVLNDVTYNIYVKKNGVTLATYENIKVYCTTTECTLNLNEQSSENTIDDIREHLGVTYTTDYDKTTRTYTLTYSSIDGSSKNVALDITKLDNYFNISICSTSLSAVSGTLTCTIGSQYQNDTVVVDVTVDGGLLLEEVLKVSGRGIDLGKTRYLLALVLVLVLVGMGATSGKGSATIVLGVIGFILASAMVLIDVSGYLGIASFLVWLFVGASILIWKSSKNGGDS